jgi:competence protein ComEC
MAFDRRLLAPVLVAAMVLLSGCGVLGGGGTPTSGPEATTAETDTVTSTVSTTTTNATVTTSTTGTVAAGTGTSTPFPTPTQASPTGIRVVEIQADGEGADGSDLNAEYIVLKNTGDDLLDLSGWSVKDEDGHVHTFADGVRLEVGATMTLHSGSGSQSTTDRFWWADGPVWDDHGETITIFDDTGNKVYDRTYG